MTTHVESLRRLASTSGVYLLGGMTQQVVGFLLLPVYIRLLTPAEYGALEIVNTTGLIVLMCVNLGLPAAIVACYHRDCKAEEEKAALLWTALAVGVPALVLGAGAMLLTSRWLAVVLLGGPETAHLVDLVAVWVLLTGTLGMVQALFRARQEASLVTWIGLLNFVLLLGLNLLFVYSWRWGIKGILFGNIFSTLVTLIVAVSFAITRARPAIQWSLLRPLVAFGVLVVPAALAGWTMNMADRYFLGYYDQLASVGIYSLGYKFGMITEMLVVAPFQLAWAPIAFSISGSESHRGTFAKTLTYFTFLATFCVLAVSLLSWPLLHVIGGAEYRGARAVVPIVALAYLFNGVHYCVSPGIHIERKSWFLPLLACVASLLHLALNVLLIPRHGIMGAAWSTAASFGVLAITTLVVSTTVHPIKYEYSRLTKIAGASLIVYAIGVGARVDSPLTSGVLALVVLFAFPLVLLVLGFFSKEERSSIGSAALTTLCRLRLAASVALQSSREVPK